MTEQPVITTADDDRIAWLRLRSVALPLASPISDAKVLTGRQKPMTEIAILIAEVETRDGQRGQPAAERQHGRDQTDKPFSPAEAYHRPAGNHRQRDKQESR